MGHGGYSSDSRKLRADNSFVADITANDYDLETTEEYLKSKSYSYTTNSNGSFTVACSSAKDMKNLKSSLERVLPSVSYRGVADSFVGYSSKGINENFTSTRINDAMNPYGVKVRESRDSEKHPNSIPIIIALDETGSMGSVPQFLVTEGLPKMMEKIIKSGIPDPQILFLGIGDHTCDSSPLQVGQFESSDELLDKWLTSVYLEGHGGGNDGESYLLAHYFAACHTAHDNWEKRGKKGYLITIGDEPCLDHVPSSVIQRLMGSEQPQNYTAAELIDLASKTYNVFHINIKETSSGSREKVNDHWAQLLHDNFIQANHREDVADIISNIILKGEKVKGKKGKKKEEEEGGKTDPKKEEMML
jgi:hypothetical protein